RGGQSGDRDARAALVRRSGEPGPFGSYAGFSDPSKVMLSILMLLGRVEIVPITVLCKRSYWRS
ncbi:MAG: hypothetical protein ABI355_02155, partial [Solirubrobacteraceae bacterium]